MTFMIFALFSWLFPKYLSDQYFLGYVADHLQLIHNFSQIDAITAKSTNNYPDF